MSTVPVPEALEEPGTGVYQMPESTPTIVPLSLSRGLAAHVLPSQPSNEQDSIPVTPTPTHPKRSITIQRLGMQTPSPPWAVRHMLTRGGGRFSLVDLSDFHRPASERLAVQYVEGENDIVAAVGPKPVFGGVHRRQMLDTDLAPGQLRTFKHLVTVRLRHLESMDPLKLAIHNNLTRLITSSSRPGRQVGSSSVTKTPKSKSRQVIRRTHPILPPLDTDAARAYMSTNPTSDSPPESPGPATPTDETTGATRTFK
ncbi:hypothetical protein FRC10_010135 [Ceratobasidium sp. 414]|nr:hypothetical protein FRC10_010135 [Ceratobasidium sp. 414]